MGLNILSSELATEKEKGIGCFIGGGKFLMVIYFIKISFQENVKENLT